MMTAHTRPAGSAESVLSHEAIGPAAGPITVLLADDDPLIVVALGQGLRAAGFAVLEAFDGIGALECCMSRRPAVAVIDHAMPGLSGIELARAIADKTDIPVIFLSAYDDESIVGDAISAGAMSYLVKPVDTEQLIPVIRTTLQRARELHALRTQAHQLNSALQTSRTVSTAIGVLMARLQIGQQDALERLRRYARSNRSRLEDVAAEVLRTTDEAGRLLEAFSSAEARGRRAPPETPECTKR